MADLLATGKTFEQHSADLTLAADDVALNVELLSGDRPEDAQYRQQLVQEFGRVGGKRLQAALENYMKSADQAGRKASIAKVFALTQKDKSLYDASKALMLAWDGVTPIDAPHTATKPGSGSVRLFSALVKILAVGATIGLAVKAYDLITRPAASVSTADTLREDPVGMRKGMLWRNSDIFEKPDLKGASHNPAPEQVFCTAFSSDKVFGLLTSTPSGQVVLDGYVSRTENTFKPVLGNAANGQAECLDIYRKYKAQKNGAANPPATVAPAAQTPSSVQAAATAVAPVKHVTTTTIDPTDFTEIPRDRLFAVKWDRKAGSNSFPLVYESPDSTGQSSPVAPAQKFVVMGERKGEYLVLFDAIKNNGKREVQVGYINKQDFKEVPGSHALAKVTFNDWKAGNNKNARPVAPARPVVKSTQCPSGTVMFNGKLECR